MKNIMKSLMTLTAFLVVSRILIASEAPNVVLLIGDDHGYPYFGFMGDENVVTPSMDSLAEGGVTFSHGFASANHCRPSLRTMITGLHPIQYKSRSNSIKEERRLADKQYSSMSRKQKLAWDAVQEAAIMREFDTLPKLLATKGYKSWQGGKWWENTYENGHFSEGMTQGWDMSLFDKDAFFFEMMGADGTELGRSTMEPLFDFIDRHQEEPFFIWYGPALPHTPFDAPYSHKKYYQDKKLSDSAKLYYGNITWWDDGVGKLLDHMENKDLLKNTLFIYISDNGWEQEPEVEYYREGVTYENDMYFANGGDKGKLGLYDQSFRSPIIFYWKDHIQGSFNETSLVSAEDIVPTILDYVGIDIPEGLPGYSLKPLLEGKDMDERAAIVGYTHQRRSGEDMMGQKAEGYFVRTSRWHFIWHKDIDKMELYDITVDSKSEFNLIEKFPHLIEGFKEKIEQWKKTVNFTAPIPVS